MNCQGKTAGVFLLGFCIPKAADQKFINSSLGNRKLFGSFSRLSVGAFAFLAIVLIFFSTGQAQIVGKRWQAQNLGIEMILNQDGTYRFVSSAGISQGVYALNGEILQMQDSQTGFVSVYRVSMVRPGTLILADSYGGAIQLTAAIADNLQSNSSVLANSGSYQLTESDVAVGYDLVSLIINSPLTEREKARLRKKSIEEFKKYPVEFLQQINSLRQSLAQIHQIRDPFQAGLMRQMLFAELYLASKPIPENQKPEIIRIITEHVRVIAEDPTNKLVLTDREVDAFLQYQNFIVQLVGTSFAGENLSRDQFINLVKKQYASLPLDTKQGIAAIYPIWQAIKNAWAKLNVTQRNQIVAQYRASLSSSMQQSPNYYKPILTDPEAMSQASPQEIYHRKMESMKLSVMQGWFRQNTFLNTLKTQVGLPTSFF